MRTQDIQDVMNKFLKALRKKERVCLFIDNSNLFHALLGMNLEDRRLDYIKLRDYLADGRDVTVRFYYSSPPSASTGEEQHKQAKRNRFYDFLGDTLGYTMIELPLRERTVVLDGETQQVPVEKGLDCEIVYDMAILSRSGRYDAFILVTGDEDYARTIRRIKNETGLAVEVAFFSGSGCSSVLVREASKFIDLSKVQNELFRPYRREATVPFVARPPGALSEAV